MSEKVTPIAMSTKARMIPIVIVLGNLGAGGAPRTDANVSVAHNKHIIPYPTNASVYAGLYRPHTLEGTDTCFE
jgi:fructose-specific phosphotransferase system IIC component